MMRTGRNDPATKLVRGIGQIIDFLMLAAIVLVMLIGLYALWDSRQVYASADSANYEVYRPSEEDSLSFEELQKKNSDVIGWLTVYGTGIDYPLVQGTDNFQYVNTDAEGSYALSGAIFLDYENHGDFSDPVNIIYGHHMSKGEMFGDIEEFADSSYLESHRYGTLYYGGRTWGLEIFAYLETDAYDSGIYNVHLKPEGLSSWMTEIEQKASVYLPEEVAGQDHLVLLSTCSSDYTDARQIAVAKITENVPQNLFPVEEEHKQVVSIELGSDDTEWRQVSCEVWKWILLLLIVVLVCTLIKLKQRLDRKRKEKHDQNIQQTA
jgi:sortase B